MTAQTIADLIQRLAAYKEVGGYENFVVVDDNGVRYEISDLECPGNGLPLLIRVVPR